MARSATCPDCNHPVSVIRAKTTIRGGAVVLLCPDCVVGSPKVAPAPPPLAPPAPALAPTPTPTPALAPTLTPTPTPTPALAPTPTPTPAPAPAPASPKQPRPVDLADITGEIALQSADEPTHPSRLRSIRMPLIAAAALVVVAGGLFGFARPSAVDPASMLTSLAPQGRQALSRIQTSSLEPKLFHELSIAFSEEQAALSWVHPIAGVAGVRQMPDKDDRRFGAQRPGERPIECGAGHCGVDLGGGRGAVVHAALGGKLIRVKRDAGGASGRYIAIEHPQGLRSHYMHLDRVHPNLVEGAEIASGEALGTLGSTGVRNSPPHLHFTVQKLTDAGWLYTDPEPMLSQATLLLEPAPMPDRARHEFDVRSSPLLKKPPVQKKAAATPIRKATKPVAPRPQTTKPIVEKPMTTAQPKPKAAQPPPNTDTSARAGNITVDKQASKPVSATKKTKAEPASPDTILQMRETPTE